MVQKTVSRYSAIFIMILGISLCQAEPRRSTVNPAYLDYLEASTADITINQTTDGYPLGYVPPPYLFNTSVPDHLRKSYELPTTYDLRSAGNVSSVKNQGSCGSCWTFATYGSIESYWLGLGLSEYDLSENNLNYGHGFLFASCEGGNSTMSTAYLSRGAGPISEEDDPFESTSGSYHAGLTPQAYVGNACFLPNDADIIKQFLLDYGALYTTLHVADPNSGETSDDYLNSDFTYYYDGDGSPNHAVTIVGWDDNMVVDRAPGNGAWIIKNSWGPDWGVDGFFYVSYYDTKINSEVAAWPDRSDYDPNAIVHYYDKLGETSAFGWSDGTDYALVKYTAADQQNITRVGTWISSANAAVSFDFYGSFSGSTPSNLLGSTETYTCDYSGYYTFELATPFELTPGSDVYILVEYNTPGYNYTVPIETAVSGYTDPTIETGIFWASNTAANGSWLPLGTGTSYLYDPCIKMYGELTNAPIASITPTALSSSVATGGSDQLSFSISNIGDAGTTLNYAVSWEYVDGTPTGSVALPEQPVAYPHLTATPVELPTSVINSTPRSSETLSYHGSMAFFWDCPDANGIPEFGTRFTPLLAVDTLRGAWFYWYAIVGSPSVAVNVYSDNGSGKPGTSLGSVSVPVGNITAQSWNYVDLSALNLAFNANEDFYISYAVSNGVYESIGLQILSDGGGQGYDRSYAYYSGVWYTMGTLFSGNDYEWGIQAQVSYAPLPEENWLTVSPTSGTCEYNETDEITVDIDAAELEAGQYTANIIVGYNVLGSPTIIEFTLDVGQEFIIADIQPVPGEVTINENDTIHFSVDASNPDGNALSYLWELAAAPVSTADTYDFTTGYASAGNYTVDLTVTNTVTASDTSFSWNIIVNNVNQAPGEYSLLAPADSLLNSTDTLMVFQWEKPVDNDDDPLTYMIMLLTDSYQYQAACDTNSISLNTIAIAAPHEDYIQWSVLATDGSDTTWSSEAWYFMLAAGLYAGERIELPATYSLGQNYPNPFNPTTTLEYRLPQTSQVALEIYNLAGQLVERLVDRQQEPGYYTITWDAGRYSSGVYFYRIRAGEFQQVKKMLLVK